MPIFKIIASQIGNDAGPFTIKNNLGQVIATGVTRLQLLNGYSFNVATGITSVTVTSTGDCTNEVTLPIPNEGYWEMEKAGVEQVSDHYGQIANAYVSPVETFVADDVVGIYSGVLSGTGTWLIKGGPEDITGTTYNGGGTLIVTGANTLTGTTTVENNAILQLGYDIDSYKGTIAGALNVQAGGVVDIVGANETARVPYGNGLVSNLGTVNFQGPDRCGEGNFRHQGTFDNRSLVTIDDAKLTFNNPTTFGTQVGTIQVLDGGTISNSGISISNTQNIKLNGCGKCNATGVQEGAFLYSGAVTIASPIEIESDTCMKNGDGNLVTFNGKLTGSSNLLLGNWLDAPTKYGSASFTNAANTFTGDLTIRNTTLIDSHPLAFQYSDVIMEGTAYIQSTNSMTFKSLSSTSPNTRITTWNVPIILTDNGITTFAGLITTSSAGYNQVTIDGVGNEINFTNSGSSNGGYKVIDGAKMSFSGGQPIGELTANNGGKFTFAKTTTGYVNPGNLTMTNNSVIEVQAISPTSTGWFKTFGQFNVSGGYKVDLVEPLVAGTYNILQAAGGGTGVGQIPTIGINNTGLTPTFSWSGSFLRVTLA